MSMQKISDTKEIQKRIFAIAKDFHKIMSQNKIPYYMLGGTMLGAIRHKGFIPWDDDMDFGIPRTHYTEALDILKKELPKKFHIKTSNDGSVLYDSSKIEDTTTIMHEIEENTDLPTAGLFIDIFPLDEGNNCWGITSRNWWIRRLWGINSFKFRKPAGRVNKIIAIFVKFFPPNFFKKLASILLKKHGDYIINYGGFYEKKEIIPKKVFGDPTLYNFEDTELYGVADYDRYLKALYNSTYMDLPPVEKRRFHIIECFIKE